MNIIIFLGLLILGYLAGSSAEKKHYRSLERREQVTMDLPVMTTSMLPRGTEVEESILVTGSAVISIDYFKRILSGLINIVGGKVISYESLVDRARREAILRLKDQAKECDYIINLRIETSAIGNSANNKNSVGSVEVLAFGTAVRVNKNAVQL